MRKMFITLTMSGFVLSGAENAAAQGQSEDEVKLLFQGDQPIISFAEMKGMFEDIKFENVIRGGDGKTGMPLAKFSNGWFATCTLIEKIEAVFLENSFHSEVLAEAKSALLTDFPGEACVAWTGFVEPNN